MPANHNGAALAEHVPEAQCWSGSELHFRHQGPQAHMSHTPLLGPQWGQWRIAQLAAVVQPAVEWQMLHHDWQVKPSQAKRWLGQTC